MREVSITSDVVGVDSKKNIVSVKNDRGEVVDLHLKDPEQVKLVKKGERNRMTRSKA